jgi:hypothetical protein
MLGYAVELQLVVFLLRCALLCQPHKVVMIASIIQLLPLYKGLNFLTFENLKTGTIHPLFKINCHSAVDAARLPIKLKLLTDTYIVQSKRIRMYKNETDPKCLLCAKEEENIEHFITVMSATQGGNDSICFRIFSGNFQEVTESLLLVV